MSTIPTIDMVKTGQNIIRLRKEKGLTVKELQTAFGFETPQAIYKWQHGTALPSVDNLVILAALLEVQVDEILVVSQVG
ncbi:MAG: helix-turn-helix transcriptional regulator [Lachnospiraceae bacterium]|nr:helix-turn-helix transcriptional regulator [Lachnospiraceae bacterium]